MNPVIMQAGDTSRRVTGEQATPTLVAMGATRITKVRSRT
jgi:hypothetical protein